MEKNDEYTSLLCEAVIAHDVNSVRKQLYMHRNDIDINYIDCNGFAPLHYAVCQGAVECVDELLKCNCNPNIKDSIHRRTPLHYASDASVNTIKAVEMLAKHGGSDLEVKDKHGLTPYERALQCGHNQCAKMLYSAANITTTTMGSPPQSRSLFSSLFGGTGIGGGRDVATSIVRKKKPYNNNAAMEALLLAAQEGNHQELIGLLYAGEHANPRGTLGVTPLHLAAENGHIPCVALLMEHGADARAVNDLGWTPLHSLTAGTSDNHTECADLLLQMGANVFARNKNGETALDMVCRFNVNPGLLDRLRAAEGSQSIELLGQLDLASSSDRHLIGIASTIREAVGCVTRRIREVEEESVRLSKAKSAFPPNVVVSGSEVSSPIALKPSLTHERKQHMSSTREYNVTTEADRSTLRSLTASFNTLKVEKHELEKRCKKLMASIATMQEEHDVAIDELQSRLDATLKEKDTTLARNSATMANKLAKISQETETAMMKLQDDLALADVLALQRNRKLSWIPDKLVSYCMNSSCRNIFKGDRRRHHCRCCGRVFCIKCVTTKLALPIFGYDKPVPLCESCTGLQAAHDERVDGNITNECL